jgi:hypothetical protein
MGKNQIVPAIMGDQVITGGQINPHLPFFGGYLFTDADGVLLGHLKLLWLLFSPATYPA